MPRTTPAEPPATPLTDGVVAVRPRRAADVDAIAEAGHDPGTRRWLDDPPMDARARATSMARVEEAWSSGRAAPLVIADAGTDEPLGLVNLRFLDDHEAAVAYSVFPAARGRGVAPRAVRLVVGWALGELALARLLLEADVENTASVRVAEKCGFARLADRVEPRPDGGTRTVAVFVRSAG